MSEAVITALAWVPRGAARERPVRFELSEEEYSRIQRLAALEEQGETDDREARKTLQDSDSDDESINSNAEENVDVTGLEAYNMADYDAEEIDIKPKKGQFTGGAFGKGGGITNANDDNDNGMDRINMIETHGVALGMDADSEDEDADDDQIKPTDSLLVVALTEDEHSHLEVQLLSEDGQIYTHHDIALPEYPLCLAWTDCPPYRDGENEPNNKIEKDMNMSSENQNTVGNYIAVGTFQPGIEIWNLDVLDPIEPSAILGGTLQDEELEAYKRAELKKNNKKSKKEKKALAAKNGGKKGKSSTTATAAMDEEDNWEDEDDDEEVIYRDGSHTDAILSLSWNHEYRQLLASGSADHTVKIWDMTTRKCSHTFTHHHDKVQCVLFHPNEPYILATGSFDQTVSIIDCRSGQVVTVYNLPSEIESMQWDPHYLFHLYCSCENGEIVVFDMRITSSTTAGMNPLPLCIFKAHDKTCTSISFSSAIDGYMATASVDKTVRIWDCQHLHTENNNIEVEVVPISNTTNTTTSKKSNSNSKAKKGKNSTSSASTSTLSSIKPKLIAEKRMNAGKLFALQCYKDSPYVLATGGDKGSVAVWLSDEMEPLRKHFDSRIGFVTDTDTATATEDVLRAQVNSAYVVTDDVFREAIFATHGSDEDSDDEEDEDGDEMDMDGVQDDGELDDPDDLEDEDESWMDNTPAPVPAPVPAPAQKGKGKGKGKGKSKGK